MSPIVQDNPDKSRFEILIDGEVAGFEDYRIRDGVINLLHTEHAANALGKRYGYHANHARYLVRR